jgi:hypothetical protein
MTMRFDDDGDPTVGRTEQTVDTIEDKMDFGDNRENV